MLSVTFAMHRSVAVDVVGDVRRVRGVVLEAEHAPADVDAARDGHGDHAAVQTLHAIEAVAAGVVAGARRARAAGCAGRARVPRGACASRRAAGGRRVPRRARRPAPPARARGPAAPAVPPCRAAPNRRPRPSFRPCRSRRRRRPWCPRRRSSPRSGGACRRPGRATRPGIAGARPVIRPCPATSPASPAQLAVRLVAEKRQRNDEPARGTCETACWGLRGGSRLTCQLRAASISQTAPPARRAPARAL